MADTRMTSTDILVQVMRFIDWKQRNGAKINGEATLAS